MKFLTVLLSAAMMLPGPFFAFADQGPHTNDVLGKLFRYKADKAERLLRLDEFPGCDDPRVLKKIVKRYNWAEKHTWRRGVDLNDVTQAGERLTLVGDDRLVNRRYCRGHARMSDGRHSSVYYLIEQRQGFASIRWNVEFCITGRDNWRVYNGSCRSLRR